MPHEAHNDGQPRNKDPEGQKEQVDELLNMYDQGAGDEAPDQNPNTDLDTATQPNERTELEKEDEEQEEEGSQEEEAQAQEAQEGAEEPESQEGEDTEEEEKSREELRKELEQEREMRKEQEEKIENLRGTVEEISAKVSGGSQQEPQSSQQQESSPRTVLGSEEQGIPEDEEVTRDEIMEFATPDEIEEALANPQKFQELLTRVYNRAREDTIRDASRVARKAANETVSSNQLISQFFEDNPNLRNHKKLVSVVANDIRAQNPDIDDRELLQKTAEEARRQLGIAEAAQETEQDRRNGSSNSGGSEQDAEESEDDPAFADQNKQNRSPSSDSRTDRQKQIDELIQTA